jgi:hypothetical protein
MFYNDQQPCSKDCPADDKENSDTVGNDSEGEDGGGAKAKPKTPKKPAKSGKFERVGKWFKEALQDMGRRVFKAETGGKCLWVFFGRFFVKRVPEFKH